MERNTMSVLDHRYDWQRYVAPFPVYEYFYDRLELCDECREKNAREIAMVKILEIVDDSSLDEQDRISDLVKVFAERSGEED